ncbi:hypothetical protein C8J57DRAFT_1728232 [Mycena rebaudengoi]|nr:hypothetical protein C8J57DRAFT_1728232 [Mycena rebaudengoi]
MPYLFPEQKVGYRDEPNQPWEGTGADYTEFSASIARRLLPFPDSPLRAKNPDMPVEEKILPLICRYKPPVPKVDRSYVHSFTVCQVLVEATYHYNATTQTHSIMIQLLIRPVETIPVIFHISPRFVRAIWSADSGHCQPSWVVERADKLKETDMLIYVINDFESKVRSCASYAQWNVNADVSASLLSWAQAVTPHSVVSSADELWPAITPPRKKLALSSTRERADRVNHKHIM